MNPPAPPVEQPDIANLIDLDLTASQLSEEEVARGCDDAKRQRAASVLIRPSDVELVARWMGGSSVRLCAVVDSPSGSLNTAAKLYAVRDLLRRGAQDIETVLNTGKLVSRQFQYLEIELLQMAEACHLSGGILKVHLDSRWLTDELRMVACRVARRAEADYIGTGIAEDIPLLKEHSREKLKIKLIAPEATDEVLLTFHAAGVTRFQRTWGLATPAPEATELTTSDASPKID